MKCVCAARGRADSPALGWTRRTPVDKLWLMRWPDIDASPLTFSSVSGSSSNIASGAEWERSGGSGGAERLVAAAALRRYNTSTHTNWLAAVMCVTWPARLSAVCMHINENLHDRDKKNNDATSSPPAFAQMIFFRNTSTRLTKIVRAEALLQFLFTLWM